MSQIKNKTILITGGAGFIGSNLCDYFLKENKVICLDNLSTGKRENTTPYLNNPNYTFIEGDIRNFGTCLKACEGVDVIMHQAALGSVPRSINDPITSNEVNVTGFLNMLNAANEKGIKRFIYAASSSTYGDSKALPKIEENIGAPLSPYAVTKYVNELYAKVFGDLYGMETIGLRYFNVFGRRQTPDGAYAAAIPKFIKALLNSESPQIHGDGEQTRDFTYIDNVIHANECAANCNNKEAYNQVFNVAFGSNITINKVIETLKENLSIKHPEVNKIQSKYVASRVGDVRDSLASIEKGKKLLQYNPEHSFEDGIKVATNWYLANL